MKHPILTRFDNRIMTRKQDMVTKKVTPTIQKIKSRVACFHYFFPLLMNLEIDDFTHYIISTCFCFNQLVLIENKRQLDICIFVLAEINIQQLTVRTQITRVMVNGHPSPVS